MNVFIMNVFILFLVPLMGCFSQVVNDGDANGDIQSAVKQLQKDVRSVNQKVTDEIREDRKAIKGLTDEIREGRKAIKGLTDEIRENRKLLKQEEIAIKGLLKFHETHGRNRTETHGRNRTETHGRNRTSPAKSCKWLKENERDAKSGLYWISLATPTQVYCDMDAGEGGWTMVGSAAIVDASKAEEVIYTKIMSDDISQLSQVSTKRFLLSASGLNKLKSYIGFTQIRFNCYKPWHGRTLHIYTRNNDLGRSVISMLTEKSDVNLEPCGSYGRFADDNSILGKNCARWSRGWYANERDGGRMYSYPMFINSIACLGLGKYDGRFECDDIDDLPGYTTIGEWSFYVR